MIVWPSNQAQQALLVEWACKRTSTNSILYPVACAIQDGSGTLQAVAVFHEYRKTDIQITFAAESPRWATRSNIVEVCSYPFASLGVRRITAMTGKANKRARQMLEFAGFHLEGVLRDATAEGPLCLYGMTRSDFAELSRKHGKTKRTTKSAGNERARSVSLQPV